MKKFVAVILSLLLVGSLTACSGNEQQGSAQSTSGETNSQVSEGEEEVTLTLFHTGDADGLALMDNMADFESKNPGVTVEDVVTPFAEYHQKLMTVAASGSDEFDVVFVESDYVAQMGEAGVLEPLNAYVENSETMSWDDYIESVVQRNCIDGTYYAMPQVADVQTTIYNRVVLDALGIDTPPKTQEKFLEYCKQAQAAGYEPLATRYDSNIFPTQHMGLFLQSNGGSFVEKSGDKWVSTISSEIGKSWLEYCREFCSTINGDNLITMDSSKMISMMEQNKAGCTIAGSWFWDSVNEETAANLVAAPFPEGENGTIALMSGWNLGIFSNSSHKDLAFKMLEWKNDPEIAGPTTAGLSGRKDAEEYFTDEQKEIMPLFQELMGVGVGMTSPEFEYRSELSTALYPVFQEVAYNDNLSVDEGIQKLDEAIQGVLNEKS